MFSVLSLLVSFLLCAVYLSFFMSGTDTLLLAFFTRDELVHDVFHLSAG